ncbi:hypothetical protein HHI36_007999, partial [Cryptolaemus montrouzieri]
MYLGGSHVQQMVSTATADNLVLNEILQKHENIFADGKFDIGTIRNYEASIKLTENRFVTKRPYRCSLQDRDEIDSQVKALLKANLIESSTSPFGAPVTLVFKKED